MDCSICLEAVTKQTGIVTLSCEHTFHFRCIDNWFAKQLGNDLEQSCPCCRHTGNDMDRIDVSQVNEDDDDDDESYEDDDETASIHEDANYLAELLMSEDFVVERSANTGQILITPSAEISFNWVRNLFGPLNDLDAEPVPYASAATKIQAVYRGYKTREIHRAAFTLIRGFLHIN